jgi:phage shock protein E
MSRLIIDVREPHEYATGHVEGALNIPPQEIMAGSPQLSNIAKDTELLLYCKTGNRSKVAMILLAQQGYTRLKNGINKDQVIARYDV